MDLLQENDSTKKKTGGKKKRKKTDNDEVTGLLNTGGFQETINIPKKEKEVEVKPTETNNTTQGTVNQIEKPTVTTQKVSNVVPPTESTHKTVNLKIDMEEYEQHKLNQRLLREKEEKKKADAEEAIKKKEADLKLAKQKNKDLKAAQKKEHNQAQSHSQVQEKNNLFIYYID